MSWGGLMGEIFDNGEKVGDCLVIGGRIPRIHRGDGLPVYFVRQHDDGTDIQFRNGITRKMLAYPSSWPSPGGGAGTA